MRKALCALALLVCSLAKAATITITWSAGAGYPGGTTYELWANECHKTGLTATSTTCSLPSISNPATQPVVVIIRAVPSTGPCNGTTCPSDWVDYSSVDATTDTTAPSTPTGLSATATGATTISVSWTASTDNVAVTGYNVRRCAGAACTPTVVVATPAVASFGDTGLTASTLYRYTVQAYDAAGNLSSQSAAASATTGTSLLLGPSSLWWRAR